MPPKVKISMRYKANRLKSYNEGARIRNGRNILRWADNNDNQVIEPLAECGFYYTPIKTDYTQVTCYYCDKKENISSNVDIETLLKAHVLKNDTCLFSLIMLLEIEGNRFNTKESSLKFWSLIDSPLIRHPLEKSSILFRKKFYGRKFPLDSSRSFKANSKSLSHSGFIYSPVFEDDDRVSCIYCNCSLEGWEADDDPLEEHRKNSVKYCYFLDLIDQSKKHETGNDISKQKNEESPKMLGIEEDINEDKRLDDREEFEFTNNSKQLRRSRRSKKPKILGDPNDDYWNKLPDRELYNELMGKKEETQGDSDFDFYESDESYKEESDSNLRELDKYDRKVELRNTQTASNLEIKEGNSEKAQTHDASITHEHVSSERSPDELEKDGFERGKVSAFNKKEVKLDEKTKSERTIKRRKLINKHFSPSPPDYDISGHNLGDYNESDVSKLENEIPVNKLGNDSLPVIERVSMETVVGTQPESKVSNSESSLKLKLNSKKNEVKLKKKPKPKPKTKAKAPKNIFSNKRSNEYNILDMSFEDDHSAAFESGGSIVKNVGSNGHFKRQGWKKNSLDKSEKSNLSSSKENLDSKYNPNTKLEEQHSKNSNVNNSNVLEIKENDSDVVNNNQSVASVKLSPKVRIDSTDSYIGNIDNSMHSREPMDIDEKEVVYSGYIKDIKSFNEEIVDIVNNTPANNSIQGTGAEINAKMSPGLEHELLELATPFSNNVLSKIDEVHVEQRKSLDHEEKEYNLIAIHAVSEEAKREKTGSSNNGSPQIHTLTGASSDKTHHMNVSPQSHLIESTNSPISNDNTKENVRSVSIISEADIIEDSVSHQGRLPNFLEPKEEPSTLHKLNNEEQILTTRTSLLEPEPINDKSINGQFDNSEENTIHSIGITQDPIHISKNDEVSKKFDDSPSHLRTGSFFQDDTKHNASSSPAAHNNKSQKNSKEYHLKSPIGDAERSSLKIDLSYNKVSGNFANLLESSTPQVTKQDTGFPTSTTFVEARGWEPSSLSPMLNTLNNLEDTANYLKSIALSNNDLHNDFDSELTNFISAMPENEENMSIEEWVKYSASNCVKLLKDTADDMISFYEKEYKKALKAIESLPTKD
ncbi:uncharacterized protein PRCAT00005694001 [Priceomyces carsonii]|uniref:uncharacterized protein n=1 Tax=Priceomyces carsonii TaxID=28549 RepID=UPI002ED78576|nr:unnamed protein product [Priceomyces carsonii]